MTWKGADVPGLGELLRDCRAAGESLQELVEKLDEASLRAPSILPGWTRGHVLAHITNVADGAARQAEFADRNELIEFYDGGRDGRDAAIEADAHRSVAGHAVAIDQALDRLGRAWPAIGSPVWDRPVTYRDGTLTHVAMMWWREIRIHLVDLDLGVAADSWSDGLCRHLLDFLAPRLPADRPVELRFDDGSGWSAPARPPTGIPLVIEGALRDVTQWLAGRSPERTPVASWDGDAITLPDLEPWPAARR
ncbi:maleylpyruvate isomerase family mycothiol-dependent enzyme [Phytoactinopolyspora halotolerans]|uniref:Maleylpyruvate isomerase family mycothiol-dependent enzyme n=1 Tax=Phytoactinopolyspora halotolerans TaxID=1981512 RepID=A0A6L9SA80_9ACTN|nr:maleylpyruvate isomerase family mycothiol-dependent enzyme [Phytoactinopolyspora halotolerans]NEE01544.1 maleylpyruvate isomerase family mycothiol-dependent enzyme [Phytoactinopolyspora halotolerans]